MNYLLKITDGPMKGAEIALVSGMRVSVGRDASCDIVVADQSLPEKAFELDVAETGVTLVGDDGRGTALNEFEINDAGTTSFAIGPAEGEWKELVRRPPAAAEPAGETSSAEGEEAAENEPAEDAERPAAETGKPSEGDDDGKDADKRKSSHGGCGCGCLAAALLLLAGLAAAWYFWPALEAKFPVLAERRAELVERHPALASCVRTADAAAADDVKPGEVDAQVPGDAAATLAAIAKEHGLELTNTSAGVTLRGDLKRRTERQAIRALALAADPTVKFDLVDDETLLAAANSLLYVVTDGAVKATQATNRVVRLAGRVASPETVDVILAALKADVPGVRKVEVDDLTVTDGLFAAGEVAKVELETTPAAEAPKAAPVAEAPRPAPRAKASRPAQPNLPVAGILTVPYPCVVLRNGQCILEGAQLGSYVVDRIDADKLTLKNGKQTLEWRP